MSKKYKADIIQFVRSKFVMPTNERIDKLALGRVGKTWRNYKYTLRQLHFKPNEKTKEQIYSDVPNGHSPSQWIKLVDYWFSPKFQRLSHNGRDVHGSLTHMHTTGCTSYANLRANFFEEEGREPSQLEFFLKSHTKKDGGFVDGTISDKLLEDAKSKVVERCPNPSSPEKVDIENEVFNDLLYEDEDPKRPIGFGFGVKKSAVFGVHGELRKRGYTCMVGNTMQMEGAIANVTKRSKTIEEKNKHLEKENPILKSQVHDHNQILMQILDTMRSGRVPKDFINTTQSALRMYNSKVGDMSSGSGTRSESEDAPSSMDSPS